MAGEQAAQAIIDAFPDGCNVVEIGGQSGHDAQVKRSDGFKAGLEGSNITVLDSKTAISGQPGGQYGYHGRLHRKIRR